MRREIKARGWGGWRLQGRAAARVGSTCTVTRLACTPPPQVMHHLSGHPHVVAFKGAYEDASHVHIVMELCTGGELFEHIAAKVGH